MSASYFGFDSPPMIEGGPKGTRCFPANPSESIPERIPKNRVSSWLPKNCALVFSGVNVRGVGELPREDAAAVGEGVGVDAGEGTGGDKLNRGGEEAEEAGTAEDALAARVVLLNLSGDPPSSRFVEHAAGRGRASDKPKKVLADSMSC